MARRRYHEHGDILLAYMRILILMLTPKCLAVAQFVRRVPFCSNPAISRSRLVRRQASLIHAI